MDPIKIGWLGACLDGPGGSFDKIHRMAFDEAVESGLARPPVRVRAARRERAAQRVGAERDRRVQVPGRRGLHRRRRRVQLRQRDHGGAPRQRARRCRCISWAGTERLQGEYCFRLGNGDVGGDAALVVAWLAKQGHTRVAVLSEISPNGEEYFRYFRQECRRRGISIAAVETVNQSPGAPRRQPRPPAPGRPRRAGVHGLRDAWRRRGCCARRSTSSRGIRRASWAPRSCSI